MTGKDSFIDKICDEIPEFASPTQLAKALGVSMRHIERMCIAGRIPALKVGHCWRIPVRPALEAMERAACGDDGQD
jgi:excisionase family DNA binding protein